MERSLQGANGIGQEDIGAENCMRAAHRCSSAADLSENGLYEILADSSFSIPNHLACQALSQPVPKDDAARPPLSGDLCIASSNFGHEVGPCSQVDSPPSLRAKRDLCNLPYEQDSAFMHPDLLSAVRNLQRCAEISGPCRQLLVVFYLAGVKLVLKLRAASEKRNTSFIPTNYGLTASGKGDDQRQVLQPPMG